MGRVRKIYEKDWKQYLMCPQCWELKEATLEFWHKQNNGFQPRCKECVHLRMQEYYKKNREQIKWKSIEYNNNNKEKIRDYRERTKEHIREHWAEYRKNSSKFKEYQKKYSEEHREEINLRKKNKRNEMGYWALHTKTARAIAKLWIRPSICPICWEKTNVEAHHPNYNKRNEIIRACNKCHQRIHNWWLECPKDIIDLLSF